MRLVYLLTIFVLVWYVDRWQAGSSAGPCVGAKDDRRAEAKNNRNRTPIGFERVTVDLPSSPSSSDNAWLSSLIDFSSRHHRIVLSVRRFHVSQSPMPPQKIVV